MRVCFGLRTKKMVITISSQTKPSTMKKNPGPKGSGFRRSLTTRFAAKGLGWVVLGYEIEIEIMHDEQCVYKLYLLMLNFTLYFLQEGDADSSGQSSPLGLTLKKTPSFLNLLQRTLSKGAEQTQPSNLDNSPQTKIDDLGSHQSQSEKLKASNFPAVFIQIGNWKVLNTNIEYSWFSLFVLISLPNSCTWYNVGRGSLGMKGTWPRNCTTRNES